MNDDTKDNLYYNYYSTQEVINALSQCDLIKHNSAPNVIVSLIANYIGIADWSPTDKSPNIQIGVLDSSHRAIIGGITQCSHHAILTNLKTSKYDTILINDWIDTIESIKRGWIYRYSLEFFGPVLHLPTTKSLFIGLITSQKLTVEKKSNVGNNYNYNCKNGSNNINNGNSDNYNEKFFANKDSRIGNDFYGHSLAWKLECIDIESKRWRVTRQMFMFRYKSLENINKDGVNIHMDWDIFDDIGNRAMFPINKNKNKNENENENENETNENNNKNINTIDIQVNFATNRFGIACNAFVDDIKSKWSGTKRKNNVKVINVECDIPKRLLKHELPMRIAVMFDHDQLKRQDEFPKWYTKSRYCAVGIKPHISNISKTIFNKFDYSTLTLDLSQN